MKGIRLAYVLFGAVPDLMPYFESVEYRERIVLLLFGGDGLSTSTGFGVTALSKTWNASSSLRCKEK